MQALRFIAAALVVVSHIRTEVGLTPFGSSGVDIFFVISGFIIYYVTRDGAPQFFTRRLIRIVPLYWLGTLALAAIALKAPGMLNHTSLDADKLLGSLFFIPVWNESVQYHLPLLTLGWSLNYEILFYLVFFIALKISHQHRLLISSLLLVSLTAVHPYAAPESALAFWSDAYVVEFIYGMLLAQLLSSTRFIEHARLPMLAAVAGLEAIREGIDYGFGVYGETKRAAGPFGSNYKASNLAAVFFSMFMPVFAAVALYQKGRPTVRMGAIAGVVILLLGIFCTYSRQAYLIVAAMLLLMTLKRNVLLGILILVAVVNYQAWVPEGGP